MTFTARSSAHLPRTLYVLTRKQANLLSKSVGQSALYVYTTGPPLLSLSHSVTRTIQATHALNFATRRCVDDDVL